MNIVKKSRWLLLFTFWVLMSGVPVRALHPNQPASSFLITHFTTDNGLPATVVDHIEQTKDGFLWLIVNNTNLVRFDGKNFHRFDQPRATTLTVAPDGDLWAGTTEGLFRIPSSNFNYFKFTGLVSYHPGPGKANDINCLRFTSGVLWVGTSDGLFRYEHDQFVAVGPRIATHQIQEAPDGHLLVMNADGFMELAGSEVVPHPGLASQLGIKDTAIFDVLKDKHGNTWYGTATGVARETNGRIEKLGIHAAIGQKAFRVYEDPQGTIWIVKDEGLFRATSAGLESIAGGMQIRSLNRDRDGNLWVGTNGDGLYRFRERGVRVFTKEDGLPHNVIKTVIAARDGTVWAGTNCGGLAHFDGTRFRTYNENNGLL